MTLIGHTCPPCPLCGAITVFTVEAEALQQWKNGRFAQDCFAHWSYEDRETLITGYCPQCWEESFPEEEDDEDYVDEFEEEYVLEQDGLLYMADDYTYATDWYVD